MKRWDCNANKAVVTTEELEKFLDEVENVCRRHGFSIAHEDTGGAFVIEKYSDKNIEWLRKADIQLMEQEK